MTTCAWLENRVCVIKTVLDQEEIIYCEYACRMSECPRYKAYTHDTYI